MNDIINVRLDSEQADLIVRALHEFRERFYERCLMDVEISKPSVIRSLDVIDSLKARLQLELNNIYNK